MTGRVSREQATAARKRVALYEQAIENMVEGICMFDADSCLVFCNHRYAEFYELPSHLIIAGTPHSDIVEYRLSHGMKQAGTLQSFMEQHRSITSSRGSTGVALVQTRAGLMISIHHHNLPDGGWVATHLDVTEDLSRVIALEVRERELKRQNLRFDAAVNNMPQGLCMVDFEGRLVICNQPFAVLYALPQRLTVQGTPLAEILAYRNAAGLVATDDAQAYLNPPTELWGDSDVEKQEFELLDGRVVAATYHSMGESGWVATHEDVTIQRQQQDKIRHLAQHDALTDLPNRASFAEALTNIQSQIKMGKPWAVLYFDLDRFKPINDMHGHAVGDALLREAALRIRAALRDSDVAARLGGDEFAVLVGPIDQPSEAGAVAQRIIDAIGAPFLIEGKKVSTSASIGIAVAPHDGTDATSLLRNADVALYRAKAHGGGNFQFSETIGAREYARQ